MEAAIATALANPATRTRDISGTGGTADMTRGIIAAIGDLRRPQRRTFTGREGCRC